MSIKGYMTGVAWEDPDAYQSPWSGVATVIEVASFETVCDIGHVHNGHLPVCPMCWEGRDVPLAEEVHDAPTN